MKPEFPANRASLASFDIYLAYDGSINSDWVAGYAINMAGNNKTRKITLLHVDDGLSPQGVITQKMGTIEKKAAARGVELAARILPLSANVLASLLQAIPQNNTTLCICGTRSTSRGKGYIAGTISEKLLRCNRFNVFTLRIVKPGILGLPRNILFPLSGHYRGVQSAISLFLLMAPQVKRIYLLRVMLVRSLWFEYMSAARAHSLHATGRKYMDKVLEELHDAPLPHGVFIDSKVLLSDDWVKEILLYANRIKAQLIIMGASERQLPLRYFYGNKIEQILRRTPCDVAIYRKI